MGSAMASTRQGKNGGTLKTGNDGNKGGTGRPSNKIREAAKAGHEQALRIMKRELNRIEKEQKAGKDVNMNRVESLAEHLGKYGVGTKSELEVKDPPAKALIGVDIDAV